MSFIKLYNFERSKLCMCLYAVLLILKQFKFYYVYLDN